MVQSASRKSGGLGLVIGIVVTVAILAVAGGAAWFFLLRSTPEKVVTKFMDAGADGNGEVAKSCLSEASAKDWNNMAPFFKRQEGADRKAKAYTLGMTTKTGDTATTVVSMPIPAQMASLPLFAGKTTLDVQMATVKERGEWKIDIDKSMADTVHALLPGAMSGRMRHGMSGKMPAGPR